MPDFYKKTIVLFLVIFAANFRAQSDIIRTKSGEKFLCKIVREDSARVYFTMSKHSPENSIKKTEIKSIEYSGENNFQKDSLKRVKNGNIPDKNFKRLNNVLAVHIGMSLPQGDFAAIDINNKFSGFAKSSVNYGISYSYLINHVIGFNIKFISSSNEFDSKPIAAFANQSTGYHWTVSKAYWQTTALNTGLILFQDLDNLRISARASLGFMNLKTPLLYMYIDRNNWIRQESSRANAICLGFGATVSYRINELLSLSFDADYYKADFIFAQISSSTSAKTYNVDQNIKQPYANLFLNGSLCFNF